MGLECDEMPGGAVAVAVAEEVVAWWGLIEWRGGGRTGADGQFK